MCERFDGIEVKSCTSRTFVSRERGEIRALVYEWLDGSWSVDADIPDYWIKDGWYCLGDVIEDAFSRPTNKEIEDAVDLKLEHMADDC